MKTPDVSLAQILAVATFVIGQFVAYGVLDDETSKIVLSGATAIITAAWKLADALIRNGRAQAVAANPQLAKPPARRAANA